MTYGYTIIKRLKQTFVQTTINGLRDDLYGSLGFKINILKKRRSYRASLQL